MPLNKETKSNQPPVEENELFDFFKWFSEALVA